MNTTSPATPYDTIRIESRIPGLRLGMLHSPSTKTASGYPVLFIHGASFPSALAAGFRMQGYSWMDDLNARGFETYALDFLGYGTSDRYPEMHANSLNGQPLGRATEIIQDIDLAVAHILKTAKATKVHLIAHSWGGSVAALYASRYPDKVADLVLFASLVEREPAAGHTKEIINTRFESMTPDQRVEAMKNLTPPQQASQLEAEVFDRWKKEWRMSDPLSSKSKAGAVTFPSGWAADLEDLNTGAPYFDPATLTIATLVIRGEWDTYPSGHDAETLFSRLTNVPDKKYVVIAKGTHVMHLEKSRTKLYEETARFISQAPVTDNRPLAVIFEVVPTATGKQEYLDLAARLKRELEQIDGFISIERFESLSHPGKILSLSFWRDEHAIAAWRNTELHRLAQTRGRNGVFQDYRLRVVRVVRDYGMNDRRDVPADSKGRHDQ